MRRALCGVESGGWDSGSVAADPSYPEVAQRTDPETRLDPSLDRIRALCDLLGDPQHGYAVVHLTGTNGKTSTSRMIDALLTGSGLRTGRYTSPHLQLMTERITLDGEALTAQQFVAAYRDVQPYVEWWTGRRRTRCRSSRC
jgi:dihydrofolate synthase/folylpolyglutamate synthase